MKEEFFSVAFRPALYERLERLQADLDCYLGFYSWERSHQGYWNQGRTPYEAFVDGIAAMRETEVNHTAA